jgi:hypothetical protein
MRLSSIELPNTWYVFDDLHGDTSMLIDGTLIKIPSGNYADGTTLAAAVQIAIRALGGIYSGFTVTMNPITLQMTIQSNTPTAFTMTFSGIKTSYQYDSGLGYAMGYRQGLYQGQNIYVSENIVSTLGDNYVLLQLPDIESSVDSFTYGSSAIEAFAKIIVTAPKNALIYDNGQNLITKQTQFSQPTNISVFRVRLTDPYGNVLALHADFSFTLEFQEVVNSKTYDAYRTSLLGRPEC